MSNEVQTVVQQCCVTEIVEKRLRESMYVALRTVRCHFEDGQLTLRGIVPTFYIKQVIFSLVEDLESEGIKGINDGQTQVPCPVESSGLRRRDRRYLSLQSLAPSATLA